MNTCNIRYGRMMAGCDWYWVIRTEESTLSVLEEYGANCAATLSLIERLESLGAERIFEVTSVALISEYCLKAPKVITLSGQRQIILTKAVKQGQDSQLMKQTFFEDSNIHKICYDIYTEDGFDLSELGILREAGKESNIV